MWDLIVSVPDHCLSFYFAVHRLSFLAKFKPNGPRQVKLVLIASASSEGSDEPAHLRSLARTSAARSYKQ